MQDKVVSVVEDLVATSSKNGWIVAGAVGSADTTGQLLKAVDAVMPGTTSRGGNKNHRRSLQIALQGEEEVRDSVTQLRHTR